MYISLLEVLASLQAKPWAEVFDRTAFAKPSGMAEVRRYPSCS
jgi:hypothetical protein